MEFLASFIVILVLGGGCAWAAVADKRWKRLEAQYARCQRDTVSTADNLRGVVSTCYLVKSCGRCYENHMILLAISPTAKSIEYECVHCGAKQRAPASNPAAHKALNYQNEHDLSLQKLRNAAKLMKRQARGVLNIYFTVPEAIMPYEQTIREHIPQSVIAEVWRKYDGRCAQCGSNQNLEVDHRIPVSQNGSSSFANLQLLCRSCNQAKGARI